MLTCVYGLGAGLAAVAFQVGMNALYRVGIVRLSHSSTVVFLVGSLVVIVATSLAVGFLLTRVAPEASGSGIPQLKAAFWKDFGAVPWRVVWVKYVAGVLSRSRPAVTRPLTCTSEVEDGTQGCLGGTGPAFL